LPRYTPGRGGCPLQAKQSTHGKIHTEKSETPIFKAGTNFVNLSFAAIEKEELKE
jgi:hypothetical protein